MTPIESQVSLLSPLSYIPPLSSSGGGDIASSATLLTTSECSGDVAEFSEQSVAAADATPRFSRVWALRNEIQSGSFETPQRIEGTVDRLMNVLGLTR